MPDSKSMYRVWEAAAKGRVAVSELGELGAKALARSMATYFNRALGKTEMNEEQDKVEEALALPYHEVKRREAIDALLKSPVRNRHEKRARAAQLKKLFRMKGRRA